MSQYDPARVTFNWNGIRCYGWASDSFIKAERDEDSFKKEISADGFAVRVQSQNKGGKVTITLQAQSPVNSLLSAAALVDEESGDNFGPLLIKDMNGTTICEADEAWIMKPAAVEYGTDGGTREWSFDCSELIMYSGGSNRP
jgi:hypothetical protein